MSFSRKNFLAIFVFVMAVAIAVDSGFSQSRTELLFSDKTFEAPQPVQNELTDLRISLKMAKILLADLDSLHSNLVYIIPTPASREQQRKALRPLLEQAVAAVDVRAAQNKNFPKFQKSLEHGLQILRPVAKFAKTYTIYLIGQSHIDIAWLWRWPETVEVCRNTFRQQLNLMQEFPEFKFTQSSAQMFKWMEDRYPELFKEIQQRVKEGRWDIVGGTVLESDCNLIGGESWVRQHLYGKRYFRKKFGVNVDIGWDPDSFGYNWNMPQFLKKSGINAFLTYKLRMNDTNVFPYHLFWWEGPDGSRILAYLPFSDGDDDYIIRIAKITRFSEANTGRRDVAIPFGTGDHGGGPERENLRMIRQFKHVTVFPKIIVSDGSEYFSKLQHGNTQKLPVWNNELYLEFHRGTYTTHGEIKRNNRKKEILLTNAEKLSSMAWLEGANAPDVPKLTRAWWKYLFNQFHDILPGSSITPVYRDAMRFYRDVGKKGGQVIDAAIQFLTMHIRTHRKGLPIVVFNTLSWNRDGLVKVPFEQNPGPIFVQDNSGHLLPSQIVASPKDDTLLFIARDVPAMGYRVYFVRKGLKKAPETKLQAKKFVLQNQFFTVDVNPQTGNIRQIFDRRNKRNVFHSGEEGNRIQLFGDIPKRNDAWNIGYTGETWEINHPDTVFVKETGPVRAVIRVKKSFLGKSKSKRYPTKNFPSSFFTQDITLYAGLPIIDCRMTVDWWENHVLAKVAFPLSVESKVATYEIPFATIQRPATRNNSWEKARFEVAAQYWGDISENGYGVSLLNESKYGYDALKNTIRLTLLRSPLSPDPTADRGINRFSYALYPHRGNWQTGKTVLQGYEYNVPLISVKTSPHKGNLPSEFSFVHVKPRTVILTTIKKAEDSNTLIFRVYESQGNNTKASLHFFKRPKTVTEVDLIEQNPKTVRFSGKTLRFPISHYQIKSFKVQF